MISCKKKKKKKVKLLGRHLQLALPLEENGNNIKIQKLFQVAVVCHWHPFSGSSFSPFGAVAGFT